MNWILRTLSESDGTPSSRRVMFALSVCWALGLATGLMVRGQVDPVVKIAETCVWATAGAVTVGKFAEAAK